MTPSQQPDTKYRITFDAAMVVPRLSAGAKQASQVPHTTCSSRLHGAHGQPKRDALHHVKQHQDKHVWCILEQRPILQNNPTCAKLNINFKTRAVAQSVPAGVNDSRF